MGRFNLIFFLQDCTSNVFSSIWSICLKKDEEDFETEDKDKGGKVLIAELD